MKRSRSHDVKDGIPKYSHGMTPQGERKKRRRAGKHRTVLVEAGERKLKLEKDS